MREGNVFENVLCQLEVISRAFNIYQYAGICVLFINM